MSDKDVEDVFVQYIDGESKGVISKTQLVEWIEEKNKTLEDDEAEHEEKRKRALLCRKM
jgi:hypothetical protein